MINKGQGCVARGGLVQNSFPLSTKANAKGCTILPCGLTQNWVRNPQGMEDEKETCAKYLIIHKCSL